MALTIWLETTGPGQGLFRISGIEAPGGSLELAIQRNLDDKYLGNGQLWQITPHWHWLPGVESGDGESSVRAGPEIVDPVAAASNMALRVLVRAQGQEASCVLRIKRHLLGSPAARALDDTELRLDPTPEPELALDLELLSEPREPVPAPADAGRPRGLLVGMLLLALVVAAGIGAWQLGWLDPWLAPEIEPRTALSESPPEQGAVEAGLVPDPIPGTSPDTDSAASSTSPIEDAKEPQLPSEVPEATPLRGVELARAFLSGNPTPPAIQAEAELQEQDRDCDAAMVLYNHAAQADEQYALALGRRLDPEGFQVQPCTQAADPITAAVWYQEAASAGDPTAQRRLGQLLIERESSGPLFEDGIRWLSQAAQAGDREAKELLAKLGKL